MSISLGLRWSSRRLKSGQAKLLVGARDARNFSRHTSISRSSRRPEICANPSRLAQQTRSLSLFGWGSSKPSDEFTKTHPQSTSPSQTIDSSGQASTASSQPALESVRTVKASHSTSEAPGPTSTSNVESGPLQTIENSILQSQNNAPPAAAASDTPDLASIPEGLGYLKDVCGLDFGWGPTSLMQFLLEHIHVTVGLSWSASIIAMVFLIRASIFPFAVSASDMTAKFQEISPLVREVQAKSKEALNNNDRTAVLEAQMQMREIKKEANFSFFKMLRPLMLQVPLGYGAWHILRTSSNLPVPAFEAEQWLWLSNIAVGDPWYILPIATAALTWANLATTQQAQGGQAQLPGMGLLRNVIPLVTGTFLVFQPASVQVYFLVNGFLTQLQLTALQNASFRRMLKLHPLPHKGPKPKPETSFSRMNVQSKAVNTTARTMATAASSTSVSDPTASPTATNRSFIDKGVDSIKSLSQQTWQKAIGDTKEKQEKKAKDRKREAQKDAAAKYEAQRRQDLENIRSYRNAAVSNRNRTSAAPPSSTGHNAR